MAADAMAVPTNNQVDFLDGTHDFDTNTFKLALFNSSFVTTTQTYSTTNELATANGYTQGGATMSGITLTGTTTVTWDDTSNPNWTASGGSIVHRYGVIWDDTAVSDEIVGYILADNAPADVTVTDGNTLTYQWNASGIFTVSGF